MQRKAKPAHRRVSLCMVFQRRQNSPKVQFDTAPTQSNAQPQIELSTIFLTFHWDQLGNIRQRGWIERLKISKVDKFESDLLKTNENIATQSRDILQTFVWWEPSSFSTPLPPPPTTLRRTTNVGKIRDFEELFLLSLWASLSKTWLVY